MDTNTIHAAAQKQILFLPHAIRQMSRPDRMISTAEVREVIFSGEIIEDYPEDPRGPSNSCCLFSQEGLYCNYNSLYTRS